MKALGIILLAFFILFFGTLIVVPVIQHNKIKKNE